MIPTLITPPTAWPVTLAEAKEQVEYLQDDRDAYLETLIRAATAYVEKSLTLSITNKRYQVTLDRFTDTIHLPRGPVTAVESVIYVDELGDSTVIDPANYTVDLTSREQWIVRNTDYAWPATFDGINALSITYTVGMENVPEDLRHAILLLIGHWFNNRETVAVGNVAVQEVPFAVDALLQNYRWVLA
jgi:uncharacterized phiE125 gp8 family phage protein